MSSETQNLFCFCWKYGVLEDSINHLYQNLSIKSKSRPKNSLSSRGVLGLTLLVV